MRGKIASHFLDVELSGVLGFVELFDDAGPELRPRAPPPTVAAAAVKPVFCVCRNFFHC